MSYDDPGEDRLRALLESVRRIAIVGLSPKPHRDSNRIARYLMRQRRLLHDFEQREAEPEEPLLAELQAGGKTIPPSPGAI